MNSVHLSHYEEYLLSNLYAIEEDWDKDQALDLLYHFAKNGSQAARDKLYQEFYEQPCNESWIGGEQIIELDGIDGFLHVAERLGKRLREDSDYWEDDFLLNDVRERFGEETVENAIEARKKNSEDLRYYLDNIKRWERGEPENKEQRAERFRKEWPIERIKEDIENAEGEFPGRYATFGRYARDEDIRSIFEQLRNEKRIPQLIRFLWIFRGRELPSIEERIISYVSSNDGELASAAILALSNTKSEKLHELAIKVMSNPDWLRAIEGIELLKKNFRESDIERIVELLKMKPAKLSRDETHGIVYDLIELAEENSCDTLSSLK